MGGGSTSVGTPSGSTSSVVPGSTSSVVAGIESDGEGSGTLGESEPVGVVMSVVVDGNVVVVLEVVLVDVVDGTVVVSLDVVRVLELTVFRSGVTSTGTTRAFAGSRSPGSGVANAWPSGMSENSVGGRRYWVLPDPGMVVDGGRSVSVVGMGWSDDATTGIETTLSDPIGVSDLRTFTTSSLLRSCHRRPGELLGFIALRLIEWASRITTNPRNTTIVDQHRRAGLQHRLKDRGPAVLKTVVRHSGVAQQNDRRKRARKTANIRHVGCGPPGRSLFRISFEEVDQFVPVAHRLVRRAAVQPDLVTGHRGGVGR